MDIHNSFTEKGACFFLATCSLRSGRLQYRGEVWSQVVGSVVPASRRLLADSTTLVGNGMQFLLLKYSMAIELWKLCTSFSIILKSVILPILETIKELVSQKQGHFIRIKWTVFEVIYLVLNNILGIIHYLLFS